ncbi:transmembrane receptor protein tyrosine kinase [Branchiostoma belcheri]|nr:transmembrane receptor protein tyrosine kinase [Branchiostoma belcheri]
MADNTVSSLNTCQNGGTLTPGMPGSGIYTCTCPTGFGGTYCDQACSAGEFGPGCTGTCHCADGGSVCDVMTGVCSSGGCAAGWEGISCQTACTDGTFGQDCTGDCHCASGGSVCDVMTGICSSGGCAAGWRESNCQTACSPGEFGSDCAHTCHCAGGDSVCPADTGVCTSEGCAAGWQGHSCQTACSPSEFGSDCAHTCHCAGGDSVCPADTGVCTSGGCAAGWQGDSCQTDIDECTAGIDNCDTQATCTNTDGSFNCTCNSGYTGDGVTCSDADECYTNADNCHTHATCSNMEGSFNCSCNPGYQGNEQNVVGVPVVGIIVGVVAGVFAIVAVGAVVFYCRDMPLKDIVDQPVAGGATNEAFDPENGRDTSVRGLANLITVEDVQRFLIDNDLQECARAFRENDVDGKALRHLDDAMMKDLVPMVGPRARLKAVLQELNSSEIPQVSSDSPISTLNFWEIPRSSLKLGRQLGRGQFGDVRLGEVRNRGVTSTVAVKTLRDSTSDSDKKDLLGELEILVTVGRHDNIISLVGACTKDGPLMIVVEYAPNGCLRDWLKTNSVDAMRNNSDQFEYDNQPAPVLDLKQLIQFGMDVAAGMSHLAAVQCVHRDLAARNILLGKKLVAKVSDFGLSRDIYESEEYVKTTQTKLPLRWMAYESLFYNVYTTKSDV